jgi:hypothetical protein
MCDFVETECFRRGIRGEVVGYQESGKRKSPLEDCRQLLAAARGTQKASGAN